MEYTIICNGRAYDLPKKTLKTAEAIERVINFDASTAPIREKYKTVYDFIKTAVGKENAAEILGGDNLDEIDLSEITLTFKKIVDAYEAPLAEYTAQRANDTMGRLPIGELEALAKAAERIKK